MYFASQRFVQQAVCVKTDKVSFEFQKSKRYFLSILTKPVSKFKYVGSIFTEDGENKEDIIQRIKEAKVIRVNYQLDANICLF